MTEKKKYQIEDISPFPGKANARFLAKDDSSLTGLSVNVYCDGTLLTNVVTDQDGKAEIKGLQMGEFSVSLKSEKEQKDESAEKEDDAEKLEKRGRGTFDPEEDGFLSWPFSEDGKVKLLAKSNQEPGVKPDTPASSVATRGELVTKLQKALSSLGYGELLGSAGADGQYGEDTKKAVMEFQRKHTYCDGSAPYSSSAPDGVVGRETAFALDRALRVRRQISMEELTEPAKLVLSLGRLEERDFTVKILSSAVEFRHQIEVPELVLIPVFENSIQV